MNTPDPCDEFLAAGGTLPVNAELRQAIFQQTTAVLRGRRRRRRLAFVAGLAACYLAGIATMRWLAPPPHAETPQLAEHPSVPQKLVAPPALVPAPIARAPAIDPQLPPGVLEQLGELANQEQRAAYFRLAGERYEKAGNVPAALRCYRQVLDSAAETELAISASDSYLLMVLKNARQKEKRDG